MLLKALPEVPLEEPSDLVDGLVGLVECSEVELDTPEFSQRFDAEVSAGRAAFPVTFGGKWLWRIYLVMITGRFCGPPSRGTTSTGTYCPMPDIRSAARVSGRGWFHDREQFGTNNARNCSRS
jgi:hypothetical protein